MDINILVLVDVIEVVCQPPIEGLAERHLSEVVFPQFVVDQLIIAIQPSKADTIFHFIFSTSSIQIDAPHRRYDFTNMGIQFKLAVKSILCSESLDNARVDKLVNDIILFNILLPRISKLVVLYLMGAHEILAFLDKLLI